MPTFRRNIPSISSVLKVFENRVLRRIGLCGQKSEEVTGGWRDLQMKNSIINIIRDFRFQVFTAVKMSMLVFWVVR
jgi:hypothetical protein